MLTGLSPLSLSLWMATGVGLDLLLGEARRWHPLVGFGNLATLLERRLNRGGARIGRGALAIGDLDGARRLTARIVCRDTADALEPELARAGAESVLENGNDAVFGTLFWFLVVGAPGHWGRLEQALRQWNHR